MDIYQIVDTFKKAVSEKTAGRSTRNKFKKLIKYISDESNYYIFYFIVNI